MEQAKLSGRNMSEEDLKQRTKEIFQKWVMKLIGKIEVAARTEESKRRHEEGISADATYHIWKCASGKGILD
jgi:hypothetical protein